MQLNNPGNSDQLDEKPPVSRNLHAEIASIQESLNQTRTEMSLYRRRVEKRQMEVDAHIHRNNVLWATMLLLIVVVGAAIAFGFHNGALVVRLPVPQASTDSAQAHLSSSVSSAPASSQEEKSTTPNRGSEVQQNPNQPQAQSPESEKPPAVKASEKIPDVPPQRKSPVAPGETQVSAPGGNPNGSDSGLLTDAVNRNRIDFEVSRNKTKEVAPGIFLTVWDTDVEHQQINGWLQLSAEGRTVMLRGQGAKKVMVFATKRDVRSHELIFTRVGKQGVSGYLLIPATSTTTAG